MGAAPDRLTIAPGGALGGRVAVPGDKSLSHRAAIIAALAPGASTLDGFLEADDTLATLGALRALGVGCARLAPARWRIDGVGQGELRAPARALDLGNAGTGLRLLAGALAGAPLVATLDGDASLRRRPMARIAAPLRAMGAEVTLADGRAPLTVRGRSSLAGIDWLPEAPSAQVKSAVLLAGLAADGEVVVREPVPTRDHTERLLGAFGVDCARDGEGVRLGARRAPHPAAIAIPGDISSAASLLIGAGLVPGAELTVEGVGLNPTRTAYLELLRALGASVEVAERSLLGAEPVGAVRVRGAPLAAIEIGPAQASAAIDELPMLMVAAACARGTTRLRGAAELAHKESDRLATTAAGLAALGIAVERHPDGLTVHGGRLRGGRVDAAGDHRIAMAFAMAALVADGPVVIDGAAQVATSFPGFAELAQRCGLRIAPPEAA
jgi:3-phosphoshikimate 1-carboxyvinyltransferase